MSADAPLRAARIAAEPSVVYRDDDLLVLNKPAGLPTTRPDPGPSLAGWAHEHDPHAPRLHASSRLDAEVTGLVTFARSDRAIQALLSARKLGQYRRFYLGLAVRAPEPAAGEFRWAIGHDPRDARRRRALAPEAPEGRAAWSRYRTLSSVPHAALLLLMPETGRTHQLRVHVAQAGAPLLGDKHYGGPTRIVLGDGRVLSARRVMLHCAQLILPGIGQPEARVLAAAVPEDLKSLWRGLSGDVALLEPGSFAP